MANSSNHDNQLPAALSSEKPEGCWNKFHWCYNKLIDTDELSYQANISWPLIVMLTTFYSLNVVSVMFAGNFGNLKLAASNLAHSWAIITGFPFIFGLATALEALSYRSRTYNMLQIHLQTSCIISFCFSTAIAFLWWYSDTILIHVFHQDHDIAKEAGVYLKFLIPGLFGYGFLQNVLRFLRAQLIIEPMVLFPLVSLVLILIHIAIIAYGLVHWTSFGFKGASLATSISIWIQLIIVGLFMYFSNSLNHTKSDYAFSFEAFHHIPANLKLALPSAALVCLEYCAYEILVLLAGLMPNPETSISIIAMSVNTQAIVHMLFSAPELQIS